MIRLNKNLIDHLMDSAKRSPRKRMNYNIHRSMDEKVQRFFNALEVDTYIRPHRHVEPNKFELFLCIKGKGAALTFDNEGNIDDFAILSLDGDCLGVEIPPNTWHTILSLIPGTVFFEAKEGPFKPIEDKDFAPWSPLPSNPDCIDYLKKLREYVISGGIKTKTKIS